VYVACPLAQRAALLNLPYITGFESWPMKPTDVNFYGAVVFLEDFQHNDAAKTWHMSDVFAARCDALLTDKTCDYIPTQDERDWAITTFPRQPGLKRIAIQVQASHRCRTYHGVQLRKVMDLLLKDGWELYMMGRPGEFGCQEIGHIHDASKHAPMFRQSAALLTTCDAFFGPDSGFLHVAGALGIPSVGVFSVFPWQLRTSQYPSVFAIQGAGDCAPCFHTRNIVQPHFPRGGPCNMTGHCTVLAAIEPERIVAKLNQQVSARP
jgi:ADP-heptose:LPS heptosyltransferase